MYCVLCTVTAMQERVQFVNQMFLKEVESSSYENHQFIRILKDLGEENFNHVLKNLTIF